MTRSEALAKALADELDLVEVSPTAEPPVCRIMDFGKYLFEQNKKAHTAKRKQKQIQLKEVKFRPGTETADYQVKLRNLIRFLTIGRKLLDRLVIDLADYGAIEQHAAMEGRQITMVISPKKK
ncbi:MAG: translation initiation factor [Steroidobacteraceae bacterium]|nr:translation initiation factor [Steroidobacteraceae bacterium]